jgi:gluconate 5-dehydrogenase
MSTLFDLGGKVALITGSSRGIGNALALGLAEAGARVVINARNAADVESAVAALRSAGHQADAFVFDVTVPDQVETAITDIEANVGPIDICVNNAGIQRRVPLHEVTPEVWAEVLDTNLTSAFLVGTAVARKMLPRQRGKIINICSIMSEVGRPTTGPYTASKGGLKMLTQAMCADWARFGLQINGIGPGYFHTELTQPLVDDPVFNGWVTRRTPAGRWGTTDELVGSAVFLASRASDYVNGHIIYVDGGLLAVV